MEQKLLGKIMKGSTILKFVKEQTEEICLAAVKQVFVSVKN